jgi:hypothetical protein
MDDEKRKLELVPDDPEAEPIKKPGLVVANQTTEEGEVTMKKFTRQKASNQAPDVEIDFGAAAAKVAHVFEPGEYKLRIESASVIDNNQNISIALGLIETESGRRVDSRALWVEGPNANSGTLAAENRNLIAQLLTLAKQPTVGQVRALIPKLAGLEFDARLVLAVDDRSGRNFNAIANIYTNEVS